MTPKQKAVALAEKLGCTLEWTNPSAVARGFTFEVTCMAPDGKWFPNIGVHEVVAESNGDSTDCWLSVIRDMETGVEACEDTECDWCGRIESVEAERPS